MADEDESILTCEEILAALVRRGITAQDLDFMTIGMCVNFVYAYDRAEARSRGEYVPDVDAQYKKLKKIQPIVEEKYIKGKLSEEKYLEFIKPIWEYERG